MPQDSDVQLDKLSPDWRKWTNFEEDQRLGILEERIERKNASLNDAIVERRKIMMRAIRRMRRAKGKT